MPDRARSHLAAALAMRRLVGKPHRRRGPLPRQQPPTVVQREYARALLAIVRAAREAFELLLRELPALVEQARRERATRDHFDAGESRRVRELIEQARRSMQSSISMRAIEDIAAKFAVQTATWQRIQLNRQTRAALGVDLFTGDRFLPTLVEGFVEENVALIKGATQSGIADRIEQVVTRGIQGGRLHGDIAKDLEKQFGYSEERARLIARDQVGKFYGQVNAARQKEMGVRRFVWRTVNDERVTGAPGGPYEKSEPSHYDLEGKVFSYDDPPPAGRDDEPSLPGEAINCRCSAEPYFDDLLEGL